MINQKLQEKTAFVFETDPYPAQWTDWRWQQRNAIRDEAGLREACGGWSDALATTIQRNLQTRKMQITPYYIDLIKRSLNGHALTEHPLWRQVVPFWDEEEQVDTQENWELHHEMKTPICQHKYENRAILRLTNTCNSYCQFCFEALRTLKLESDKPNGTSSLFADTVAYIKRSPEIEEVVLSGGDPLMMADQKLGACIDELRSARSDLLIRVHSRALTFNPYRVTDSLLATLDKSQVRSVGLHVCHPLELTQEFLTAVKKIQQVVPIVFANIPLLRGVNDSEEVLRKLFLDLYRAGVKPYYLYHFMPFSPGSEQYKTSIQDAILIMSSLKRRISNIAMPEYVLPHAKGKFTVPLLDMEDADSLPHFRTVDGARSYHFKNWQGEWCAWDD